MWKPTCFNLKFYEKIIQNKELKQSQNGFYLLDMSSSSPPQPQNEFENPLTVLNCLTVNADTPPKIELYGNLYVKKKKKK